MHCMRTSTVVARTAWRTGDRALRPHLGRSSAVQRFSRLLGTLSSAGDEIDSYNRRYWSKSCILCGISNDRSLAVELIQNILKTGSAVDIFKKNTKIDYSKSQQGMVVVPTMGIMIPIHDGKLQVQHTTDLHEDMEALKQSCGPSNIEVVENSLPLIFCGFSSRAQHVVTASDNEERSVNVERQQALLAAMDRYGVGVTETELLSAEFAGSPPARIYRSFVCPRERTAKITPTLDSVLRAAERTAEQIKFAVRQLRADQADYLRNIDRPNSAAATSIATSSERTDQTVASEDASGSVAVPGTAADKQKVVHPVVLVLDNIRSANNVGSMFRTAETAGAAEIVTCGITAHPPHPKLRKTAMQSIDVVSTRHFDDVIRAVETLKSEGYTIVAMETTSLSKQYTAVQYPAKVALVLGNEMTGVDTRIVQMADIVVEIPTYGVKNSLNVASAAPIVLFEVLRQWHLND